MRGTMNSIFRPALVIAAGRGIALAITFVVPLIFARLLTQAQFGTYKQIFLIHATVYGIGLGLAESLFYFLPREPDRTGRYVGNSIALLSATGIAGCLTLTIAREQVAAWFNNADFAALAPLIGLYVAVTLASAPLEIVMIARGCNRWAATTYAISDILRALFLLVPVMISPRMDLLLAGSIVFGSLRLAFALGFFRHEFSNELRPDFACLWKQLLYAGPLQMAVALQVLQVNLHQYVVSYSFDAATFARYAIGCVHIPVFDLLAGSVLSVMMVQMTEGLKQGRKDLVLQIWSKTTRQLAFVFFPFIALLAVISTDLITALFTDAYRPSVPLFRIWLLSYFFVTFQPHGVLRACGDTRFLALQNLVKLVLVAVLIVPMISMFGVAGADWAAVLAAFGGKCILLARVKQLNGVTSSQVLPWRSLAGIAAASLLAAIPAIVVGHNIESRMLRMFSVSGSYLLIYAAITAPFIWREEVCSVSYVLKRLLPGKSSATTVEPVRLNSVGS